MRSLYFLIVALLLLGVRAHAQVIIANPGSSDPSTYSRYTSFCQDELSYSGVEGLVYYPPGRGGCQSQTSVYSPLVIILHGNSYSYTRYKYLQEHLAKNGFISVSINVIADLDDIPTAHEFAAQEAETFVQALWNDWVLMPYINPSKMALIGHSRGGETVRYLATRLRDDPLFKVKAVVSIAGTGDTNHFTTGQDTLAYLGFGATLDSDVTPWQIYRQYDLAGQAGSQFDPYWDARTLYRGLKILQGAHHSDFADGSFFTSARSTTKGYILAFLAAHLQNDPQWYDSYIRGDRVPGTFISGVLSQTRDGFFRRTIDNFENGNILLNSLGGSVKSQNANASVLSLNHEDWTAHETHALWIEGLRNNSSVTWSIPTGKNDVRFFRYLQFRMGQDGGIPSNDLQVQIRNGNWSSDLRVAEYGAIGQPISFACGGVNCPTPSLEITHMTTIRIPLSDFGSVDNVTEVSFNFRGDAMNNYFLIDDIEFSEYILKP